MCWQNRSSVYQELKSASQEYSYIDNSSSEAIAEVLDGWLNSWQQNIGTVRWSPTRCLASVSRDSYSFQVSISFSLSFSQATPSNSLSFFPFNYLSIRLSNYLLLLLLLLLLVLLCSCVSVACLSLLRSGKHCCILLKQTPNALKLLTQVLLLTIDYAWLYLSNHSLVAPIATITEIADKNTWRGIDTEFGTHLSALPESICMSKAQLYH